MRKKICILLTMMVATITAVGTLFISGAFAYSNKTYADNLSYGIAFNSSKNKFHSYTGNTAYNGEAIIQTNLGNEIKFSYYQLKGANSTWHVLSNDGYFYNIDPIHGIESISLSFKTNSANYSIHYSLNNSFGQHQSFVSSTSEIASFDFNGYKPNYFKIVNESDANFNISSIDISLSCLNNPVLSIDSENEEMGTVTGGGVKVAGQSVTITASPYSNYYFTGWYDGDKLISTNNPYTFNMNDKDLTYTAVFAKKKHMLIKSNDKSMGDVNISGSSNAISGIISNDGEIIGYSGLSNRLIIGYPFTSIGVEAFRNNSTIEEIFITSDIVSIGYQAFAYCYNLRFIAFESSIPPEIGGDVLASTWNSDSFKIYVPKDGLDAYMSISADYWQGYAIDNIEAFPNGFEFESVLGFDDYSFFIPNEEVTIIATPNIGVSFLGWYDTNNNLVSNQSTYTFNMPYEDLEYTAKFGWTPYSIELTVNNTDMGSVIGSGSYIYNQEVTLIATPNEHFSFFGWYDGDELISQESTYTFNMPNNSLIYEARFVKNHNLYVYSDDESKGTVTYPSEWGEGLEVTIKADAKEGYALDYWYDDDLNELSYNFSYTFVMPNHDATIYAAFDIGYTLTVTSSDESKGIVTGGGQYKAGRKVTVTAVSNKYCVFKGWFNDNEQLVATNNPYVLIMPIYNYSLKANFEDEWPIKHGIIPTFSADNNIITYGLYPQTNVNDSSTISELNKLTSSELNGWYLYENDYYAKLEATPYQSNYTFDNGTTIVNGTTYWFKCEPIAWNVLSNNNGEYYLLSSVLLDAHCYYYSTQTRTIDGQTIYPNNYKYSDIRAWLNNEFYDSAFALNNEYIQATIVDNSASTTYDSNNIYSCANTEDKVFLLSSRDYDNGFYFSPGYDLRYCKTTDWIRARGVAYHQDSDSYQNNGFYWTRSPGNSPDSAMLVGYNGYNNWRGPVNYVGGIRPAITLIT